MKIPKFMDSCVICDCGAYSGWHISIKNVCYPPAMPEEDCSKIYKWLVTNDFVETKEWNETPR